jgi:hypothetical protein
MDAIFILMTLGFWGALVLMVSGLKKLQAPEEKSV